MIKYIDPSNGMAFRIDHETPMAFYVTECCDASGKGSSNSPTGVCCRACYQPVSEMYGGMPHSSVLAQIPGLGPEHPVTMKHHQFERMFV